MTESTRAKYALNGKKFFGCEVCWTCAAYNIEHSECYVLAILKLADDPKNPSYPIPETIKIKEPHWFRCPFWEG